MLRSFEWMRFNHQELNKKSSFILVRAKIETQPTRLSHTHKPCALMLYMILFIQVRGP